MRQESERGSALIIVFVFAAIVAIMLYEELPVVAFEAQRNREQLVIDRGNEYAHAVKLFVRKMGTYPSSIDQLENTNRMRFLRHRFKDPLTESGEWRLLHAGPGGQLIDSKVNPITGTAGQNGSTSASTSTSTQTAADSGSSRYGFSSSASSTEGSVAPVPQRPPAVPAGSGSNASAPAADQNPMTPLLTPNETVNSQTNVANASPSGTQPTPGAAPMDSVRNLLNNPTTPGQGQQASSSTPQSSIQSGSSQTGVINSGGLAGVASKAEGHSIKIVNDQTDYSLWEFYYDPSKDASRALAGASGGVLSPTTGMPTRPAVVTLGSGTEPTSPNTVVTAPDSGAQPTSPNTIIVAPQQNQTQTPPPNPPQ